MFRIGFVLVVLFAIVLGIVTGALNPAIVNVDLLWFQLAWPLGLTLICVLVLGVLVGLLLASLFSIWPLRMRLRKAEKQLASRSPVEASMTDTGNA